MSIESTTTIEEDIRRRAAFDRSLRHPVMFFLTSGAAWLAVSIVLGLIASAKVHSPEFLDGPAFLTYGRVFPAHVNTLIYGWGFQAAFAAILWLMARLSRQICTSVGAILTAGHLWNFAVSIGTIAILAGEGSGLPGMEFPSYIWPVLILAYFGIIAWSFVQFRVRPLGHVYITQWYLISAALWFPWIFLTANVLLHWLPGHPLMGAAINVWYNSALIFLFFIPVALGTAYYLAPKVTGRPIYSYSLAKLGFWSLAIIGPWTGLQKLAGAPIPVFIPYLSAAATAMLFIPVAAAGINLLKTVATTMSTVERSPALRFTVAGVFALLVMAFVAVLFNLPGSSLQVTQFTMAGYGFNLLAVYGFFTLVMFGAIYFIVPRVTGREWLSSRLIKMHFYFSVYGIIIVTLVALFGGLQQGAGQENFNEPWSSVSEYAHPYAVGTTVSWFFILFSNVFFFIHLALMWLGLGRRSSHPTLLGHDHPGAPHGLEGTLEPVEPVLGQVH